MKKKAIVVGSGAGGATVAKELQGQYEVTVLEAGKAFKPFGMELEGLEKLNGCELLRVHAQDASRLGIADGEQ